MYPLNFSSSDLVYMEHSEPPSVAVEFTPSCEMKWMPY
jgi:hypothetical protein